LEFSTFNDGGLVQFTCLTPDEVAFMVDIDLPPEAASEKEPVVPTRPGREPLSPKRAWRRDGLLKRLVDPTVVAETAGLLEQQVSDIHSAFQPRNGWQDWLTSSIATIMLRINRSERIERKLRDWASYRAIDFWEEDQTLAVETLASRIGNEPAKVVAKLRETPAGIDWLIARWRSLGRVEPQDWTDEERELAARLVGGEVAVDPTRDGFVAAMIVGLEDQRERVKEADAIIRGLVEADLHDDGVPGLARLRRYVRLLQWQLKWYVDQVPRRAPRPLGRPAPSPRERRTARRRVAAPQPQPLRGEGRPAHRRHRASARRRWRTEK